MKKHLLYFTIITLCTISCIRNTAIKTTETKISLEDSIYTIEMKSTLFSSADKKQNMALGELNTATEKFCRQFIDTFKQDAWDNREYLEKGMTYQLVILDSVFLAEKDLVSIRYTYYMYVGGAHGSTGYTAFNYNPQTGTFLQNNNLFNPQYTKQINQLLQKYFLDPDGCFWDKPTLNEVAAVNIGKEFVTFIYAQYVLGAYACGPATVNIPITELLPYLAINLKTDKE